MAFHQRSDEFYWYRSSIWHQNTSIRSSIRDSTFETTLSITKTRFISTNTKTSRKPNNSISTVTTRSFASHNRPKKRHSLHIAYWIRKKSVISTSGFTKLSRSHNCYSTTIVVTSGSIGRGPSITYILSYI